ncbi:ankyrin repeat-containing domain protein [Mycotypha africana]|uniref:ankyrin repeat-containing domain protein n=1 Tax=Mycotypha africana TaxID=64632 RepID=UPI002300FB23|nr:ankyrin repeat-containing domain protein [Mycotypha africana]KAI8968845.1 ankyrin repeat-containing domain protein [Mycotypha africana]
MSPSSLGGDPMPLTPSTAVATNNGGIVLPFRLRQNSNATAATLASTISSGASSAASLHSNAGQNVFDEKTQYHASLSHYSHSQQGRKGSWQHPSSTASHASPSGPPLPTSTASSSSSPAAVGGGGGSLYETKSKRMHHDNTPPSSSSTGGASHSKTTTPTTLHVTSPIGYAHPSVIQQSKVDPLSFGGSDAFWETISRESSNTQDTNTEKMISNFLRRGGSPNTAKQSASFQCVKYGYGMLHTMVVLKSMTGLELLLQHGANPNALTLSIEDEKATPGYLASRNGWLPGLQALVEAGCDLRLARGGGGRQQTALQVAAEHGHTAVVEYIVSLTPPSYHAQVDGMGASVLHYAAGGGHVDLVRGLVQNCPVLSVDQLDERGESCLHWASRHGHWEVASWLIERCGCDFNAYTPVTRQNHKLISGCTPLDLAKAGNHKRLVEYYKKLGALTAKKMEKKREEELEKTVPVHLESALSKNGLFGY